MNDADVEALKAEILAAVCAEAQRVGVPGISKGRILASFAGRASRAALYRWIAEPINDGRAGQSVARKIKSNAANRSRSADPPANVAKAAADKLPVIVTADDIGRHGPISIIESLRVCHTAAMQVIAHARTEDGKVRSSRLLLNASEHLRKTLDTASRLQEAIQQTEELQRFHRAILAMIRDVARERPEAAELILSRLALLSAQWGAL